MTLNAQLADLKHLTDYQPACLKYYMHLGETASANKNPNFRDFHGMPKNIADLRGRAIVYLKEIGLRLAFGGLTALAITEGVARQALTVLQGCLSQTTGITFYRLEAYRHQSAAQASFKIIPKIISGTVSIPSLVQAQSQVKAILQQSKKPVVHAINTFYGKEARSICDEYIDNGFRYMRNPNNPEETVAEVQRRLAPTPEDILRAIPNVNNMTLPQVQEYVKDNYPENQSAITLYLSNKSSEFTPESLIASLPDYQPFTLPEAHHYIQNRFGIKAALSFTDYWRETTHTTIINNITSLREQARQSLKDCLQNLINNRIEYLNLSDFDNIFHNLPTLYKLHAYHELATHNLLIYAGNSDDYHNLSQRTVKMLKAQANFNMLEIEERLCLYNKLLDSDRCHLCAPDGDLPVLPDGHYSLRTSYYHEINTLAYNISQFCDLYAENDLLGLAPNPEIKDELTTEYWKQRANQIEEFKLLSPSDQEHLVSTLVTHQTSTAAPKDSAAPKPQDVTTLNKIYCRITGLPTTKGPYYQEPETPPPPKATFWPSIKKSPSTDQHPSQATEELEEKPAENPSIFQRLLPRRQKN
ncbi:MAG: hypothetical protein ACQEP8_04410 [Chlamydiota bacterium]